MHALLEGNTDMEIVLFLNDSLNFVKLKSKLAIEYKNFVKN